MKIDLGWIVTLNKLRNNTNLCKRVVLELERAEKLLSRIEGIQLECSLLYLYDGGMLFNQRIKNIKRLDFTTDAIISGFRDRSSGRLLQVD